MFPADCEPRVGRVPDPADLLRCHHLEWIAETRAGLGLDLAEDQRPPAPHDHIELVARDPDVRAEDAVPAQPIPPGGATFRGVSRRAHTANVARHMCQAGGETASSRAARTAVASSSLR